MSEGVRQERNEASIGCVSGYLGEWPGLQSCRPGESCRQWRTHLRLTHLRAKEAGVFIHQSPGVWWRAAPGVINSEPTCPLVLAAWGTPSARGWGELAGGSPWVLVPWEGEGLREHGPSTDSMHRSEQTPLNSAFPEFNGSWSDNIYNIIYTYIQWN